MKNFLNVFNQKYIQTNCIEKSISMQFEDQLLESLSDKSDFVKVWIQKEQDANYTYIIEKLKKAHSKKTA